MSVTYTCGKRGLEQFKGVMHQVPSSWLVSVAQLGLGGKNEEDLWLRHD